MSFLTTQFSESCSCGNMFLFSSLYLLKVKQQQHLQDFLDQLHLKGKIKTSILCSPLKKEATENAFASDMLSKIVRKGFVHY